MCSLLCVLPSSQPSMSVKFDFIDLIVVNIHVYSQARELRDGDIGCYKVCHDLYCIPFKV